MEEKIQKIMANLFDVSIEEITDESSPSDIKKWDSLNHIKLVVELEEEFNVKFSNLEVLDMQTYKLVVLAIKNSEKIL